MSQPISHPPAPIPNSRTVAPAFSLPAAKLSDELIAQIGPPEVTGDGLPPARTLSELIGKIQKNSKAQYEAESKRGGNRLTTLYTVSLLNFRTNYVPGISDMVISNPRESNPAFREVTLSQFTKMVNNSVYKKWPGILIVVNDADSRALDVRVPGEARGRTLLILNVADFYRRRQ